MRTAGGDGGTGTGGASRLVPDASGGGSDEAGSRQAAAVRAPGTKAGGATRTGGATSRKDTLSPRFLTVHGHRRAYLRAGRGSPVLLIHGIGDSSATWLPVLPGLARRHTVIAPDLLGHGLSDKPRADYSVGGFACGMRDLLTVLGIERATVVGHSLGGGVAMQFAYQFPERCERLVLVGTGGVGPQVSPLLRLAASPGGEALLSLLRLPAARLAGHGVISALGLLGTDLGRDSDEVARVFGGLATGQSRAAFLRTLRSAVDARGQAITMLDRCYLAQGMPTLIMWGGRDAVIPVEHARIAHEAMPGSRLEIFPDAGHFPHHTDPDRFQAVLADFFATTRPGSHTVREWRALLRSRALPPEAPAEDASRPVSASRSRHGDSEGQAGRVGPAGRPERAADGDREAGRSDPAGRLFKAG
ncbi:alpha/beta fold hydrolase [Frankia sp. AgB1.9]|uniref:alpha/beta fold hydrolase n=1 Tax=unclassified Frankia TaxID=2632575 RepID=UPI001932C0FF|nr:MULTISPECIES: alpha/beta fold hydrolase [unclassified Frankia]MBL7552345.1 alpha/beta fold hydrolase [Frankia sp. AgB1.9]MBL7625492.1 alpha/beta fold hydrolase [Frankia sp. AgB1.8]